MPLCSPLIGVVGYWNAMITTLAIVMAGVMISLLIGLPVGILLSTSRRLNNFARPVLDTMQTMPVFVYLIPALLFFGLGSPSAVIATVIYAVVPVIRLTSLGIRQVDGRWSKRPHPSARPGCRRFSRYRFRRRCPPL